MAGPDRREQLVATGRLVASSEAQAVGQLAATIGTDFAVACEHLLSSSGRVICLGVGKSGIVARKAAATLASLGTPALFVHATEAVHGDLGMITSTDVVLAYSHSGTTPEMLAALPALEKLEVPIVAITDHEGSPLGKAATVVLCPGVLQEADHLGLAPTSSTTAAMVLSDALAVAIAVARGFNREDFARLHPGGSLGALLSGWASD